MLDIIFLKPNVFSSFWWCKHSVKLFSIIQLWRNAGVRNQSNFTRLYLRLIVCVHYLYRFHQKEQLKNYEKMLLLPPKKLLSLFSLLPTVFFSSPGHWWIYRKVDWRKIINFMMSSRVETEIRKYKLFNILRSKKGSDIETW